MSQAGCQKEKGPDPEGPDPLENRRLAPDAEDVAEEHTANLERPENDAAMPLLLDAGEQEKPRTHL